MPILRRMGIYSSVVLALIFAGSFSCWASSVEVHVRAATCPSGYSNCCIQTGSKGEDTSGNPYVDQGDYLVWDFPTTTTGDNVQFTATSTACPYGNTAAACQLNSGTTYIIAESRPIGTTPPANGGWPYSSLNWNDGTLHSCTNVLLPTNTGVVHPPGLVMRPPSKTLKGEKQEEKPK